MDGNEALAALTPYLRSAFDLVLAVVLGALIGYERQRRQRTAGLRTNALVALGSAAFVMIGTMVPGELSPTRVAAQVVSGIGFLCAGVIMRDGFNVRGLNTAATLWCSAAVGVMAGMGYAAHAVLITVVVLLAHLALRPLASWINRQPVDEHSEVESSYALEAVCQQEHEPQVRTLLLQAIRNGPLLLRGLHSGAQEATGKVRLRAELTGTGQNHAFLEQVVARLSLEGAVSEVSWSLSVASAEEAGTGTGLFQR